MTYSLSNNCAENYYNRTLTVQVIVEDDVVTWTFWDTAYNMSTYGWTSTWLHTTDLYTDYWKKT